MGSSGGAPRVDPRRCSPKARRSERGGVISPRLVARARCPDCHAGLIDTGGGITCRGCRRRFDRAGNDYLDLRPSVAFAEQTKYMDEALHADARHETVSPPLLSARIRNDMLRGFLRPARGDRIVDLGCGSGRVLLWNQDAGADVVGVDASPFFAGEARERMDLVLGDLRNLPFDDRAFTKAYALDVLEHLSRPALEEMLRETSRVLAPGGALFVYSHVKRNAPIAGGLRLINRLAERLEQTGIIDLSQERLRKSDHMNPIADIPDLEAIVQRAGFRIEKIRYYTPLVGGFVENILMRVGEGMLGRWMKRRAPGSAAPASRLARTDAKERVARHGTLYLALRGVTWVMRLDLVLFGRIRSGPFFALLVKDRQ